MRSFKYILAAVGVMGVFAFLSKMLFASGTSAPEQKSIYEFNMVSLDGENIDFSRYKGKYILIVNTASKCGFTPQYKDLQLLHERYEDRLHVLGFPANDFMWQEPGSDEEIAAFCEKNYGVTFQMFSKIGVKGKDQHPLFKWLQHKTGKAPRWNFCKYLIDPEGNVLGFFPSKVNPLDPSITDKLVI